MLSLKNQPLKINIIFTNKLRLSRHQVNFESKNKLNIQPRKETVNYWWLAVINAVITLKGNIILFGFLIS